MTKIYRDGKRVWQQSAINGPRCVNGDRVIMECRDCSDKDVCPVRSFGPISSDCPLPRAKED